MESPYMGRRFIREAKAWLIQMSLDGSAGVIINGEHRRVPAGTSLAQLIAEVGLDPQRVAVERNLEIVPRSTFGEVIVEDGDAYEIVHFVGGG
jgi:thiazole synthase